MTEDPLRKLVHDLRSPLAVVDGFASLLAREEVTEERQAEYAQRIRDAAAEMKGVLDEAPRPAG